MNAIGIALVWCVVQVTLIGLAAAGVYLVVRRLRPAAAASVVMTALTIIVVLSLLAMSPWPRWTLARVAAPTRTASAPAAAAPVDEVVPTVVVRPEGEAAPGAAEQPFAAGNGGPSVAVLLWRELMKELATAQPAAAHVWHWPAVVGLLLLVMMTLGLGWLLLGIWSVRRQRRRSLPVADRELLELVDVVRAELACVRPVEVRQSDDLATAATIGWRRPVLLLPGDWTQWTTEQRRAVVAHEIAHARSQDFLSLLCGQLGLVLHFYHPLLHWLMNRLRLEQELAADAAAASISGGQRKYLTTIAELALRQQERPLSWPARTFLPSRTTFLRRIAMLRDSKLRFEKITPAVRGATVGIVLLCGLVVAGLRGPAAPRPALAEEAATGAAADTTEPGQIDLSFVPEDAAFIAILRPAEFFARPGMDALAKLLDEADNVVPRGVLLSGAEQFTTTALAPSALNAPRTITILRWAKPLPAAYFATLNDKHYYTVEDYRGGKLYSSNDRADVFFLMDDRTLIHGLSRPALEMYLTAKRGVLPKWLPANAWEQFKHDQLVVAGDTTAISPVRGQIGRLNQDPSPPVQPALAAISPLLENSIALVVGARLDDRLALHGWAEAKDTESAAKVRRTLEALQTLLKNAIGDERSRESFRMLPEHEHIMTVLGWADASLKQLKFQQSGNAVLGEMSVAFDRKPLDALVSLIAQARQAAFRAVAVNNLKQIALAMLNYEAANRRFPPAVLYGPDGKTPYSWRVALLPYLEENDLYKQYRFDEPWDGPNNRKLLAKMPAVFHSPTVDPGSTNTAYFVLTGPGTLFDAKEGTSIVDLEDGTEDTLLVVEAKRDIPWTKPEDIAYDPDKPLPALGGYFEGGFNAATAEGSGHFLANTLSEKTLRALITKAGGETIPPEVLNPTAAPAAANK